MRIGETTRERIDKFHTLSEGLYIGSVISDNGELKELNDTIKRIDVFFESFQSRRLSNNDITELINNMNIDEIIDILNNQSKYTRIVIFRSIFDILEEIMYDNKFYNKSTKFVVEFDRIRKSIYDTNDILKDTYLVFEMLKEIFNIVIETTL